MMFECKFVVVDWLEKLYDICNNIGLEVVDVKEEPRFVIEPLTYVLLALVGMFFGSFRQTYYIGIICGFLGLLCVSYTKWIEYIPKKRIYNLAIYGCLYAIAHGIFCGWIAITNYHVM